MTSCATYRERFSLLLEGALEPQQARELEQHLERCSECAQLLEIVRQCVDAAAGLDELEPPAQLHDELVSSPCRRWLGLLHSAIDRDISEANLARLLAHLEACDSCRRAWNDMSLIHQVGAAMVPRPELVGRCIAAHHRPKPRIIGRYTAIAAAYLLALVIGPPVTLARPELSDAVSQLAYSVSTGVAEAAEDSKGEVRIMLWRTWQWSKRQVASAQQLLSSLNDNDDSTTEQGGSHE